MPARSAAGFTLFEMILAIVVLGIIATSLGIFIVPALRSSEALERRAQLVDAAESALRRMARDIRIGLPNSVRISATGSGFALEVVPTFDGGRYCIAGVADCAGAAQELDFTASDTDFDVLGCFRNATFTGDTFPSTAYRLVIADFGGQIYTAGGSPAVVTPAGTSLTLSVAPPGTCGSGASRHHLAIAGGHRFANQSSRQRLFVIRSADIPVSYLCDTTAGTLRRYAGYAIQAAQPTTAGALAGASSIAQVAGSVSACSATSSSVNVQSTGIVTLALTVASAGESVPLLYQVQLDNSQ